MCLWGSTIRPKVPTPIGRSLWHHSTFFKVQIKLQLSHCPKSIVFRRWSSHVGELDVRSLLGLTWDRLRNQAASGITICTPQITALVIAITSCSRWFMKSWLHKLINWIDKWIMENIQSGIWFFDTGDASEIWRSPVEVGSLSHYLQGEYTSQVVQDCFHQQYHAWWK